MPPSGKSPGDSPRVSSILFLACKLITLTIGSFFAGCGLAGRLFFERAVAHVEEIRVEPVVLFPNELLDCLRRAPPNPKQLAG
jgi:hypothetical protein